LVSSGEEHGTIVVMRESRFEGHGMTVAVLIDGTVVGFLADNEFVSAIVPTGRRVVAVELIGFNRAVRMAVEVARSSTSHLRFSFDLASGGGLLETLSDSVGRSTLASGYREIRGD
jgi:hypothetical protein